MNTININRFALDKSPSFFLMICAMSNQCHSVWVCDWPVDARARVLVVFCSFWRLVSTPAHPQPSSDLRRSAFDGAQIKQLVWRSRNNTRIVSQICRWCESSAVPPAPVHSLSARISPNWSRHELITITHSSNWARPRSQSTNWSTLPLIDSLIRSGGSRRYGCRGRRRDALWCSR